MSIKIVFNDEEQAEIRKALGDDFFNEEKITGCMKYIVYMIIICIICAIATLLLVR